MSLLQMSLTGSVIILVTITLRALLLNKLPKKMFLVLWWMALIRLLLPISLPSSFSVYSMLSQSIFSVSFADEIGNRLREKEPIFESGQEKASVPDLAWQGTAFPEGEEVNRQWVETSVQDTILQDIENMETVSTVLEGKKGIKGKVSFWQIFWMAGVFVTALFFLTAYIRSYREFRISFPIEEDKIKDWQNRHRIRRSVMIRQSKYVSTPLTYGIIRPVILLPNNTDWNDDRQLSYVLEHEFVHIRRFDMVTKLILTAAFCIHWFNPLVWILYSLFNRDLEISCDEEVVRYFGENAKSDYARTLICMEERKVGFVPLYNEFSKNAIEERIKAVMKVRKTSVMVLAMAVILVIAVFLGFATTAKGEEKDQKEYLKKALEGSLTEKEAEMLADLWIEGYEGMTVSEYQQTIEMMVDSPEYLKLIDTFSKAELTFQTNEKNGEALEQYFQYYYGVFEPLCAEKTEGEFSGSIVWTEGKVHAMTVSDHQPRQDTAELEYVLTLHIEQPDKLTTMQYRDTYLQTVEDMEVVLQNRTEAELANQQLMDQILDREIKRIAAGRSDEKLTCTIDYAFRALEHAGQHADLTEDWIRKQEEAMKLTLEEIREQEEATKLALEQTEQELGISLEPYLEYGLTWEVIPSADPLLNLDVDVKMYWQGKEVRGIYDKEQEMWVSFYAGNSKYASDAIDLYTVYEGGRLTGLRRAAEEETQLWTQLREQQMQEGGEEGLYPPAGIEDYDSLLELMQPDYEKMSVAAFDKELLDWCDKDHDRAERISEDAGAGNLPETLTAAERSFVELTYGLSGEENHRRILNLRESDPKDEKDIRYGWISRNFYRSSDDGLAFADMWYCFYWYITDRDRLTVGQRDSAIRGFMDEVDQRLSDMEMDEFLTLEKQGFVSLLKETAEKYSKASGGLLTIEIAEENAAIDRLDERELQAERDRQKRELLKIKTE